MKVGFIGLGIMGASMASNVQQRGHQLVVHDLRPEAAKPHVAAGATWADTPRRVAEAVDVVLTSLPGPPEVEAVALGPNGLLEGLSAGKAYVDLSTNSPTLMRRIHEEFAKRGIHVLDAPVSGGPRGARSRRLAVWVGGDENVFAKYKPVLDAMGDQVIRVGPIGSGSIAKLVHNCTSFAVQTVLAEVFTLGVKAGVEPAALWQAVRYGATGRQRTFDRLADGFLPARYDPANFALRLAHKDVTLATALGREHKVPMRMANLVLEEMTEALNRGWGERDSRSPMLLQQERAGVEVRVDDARIKDILDRDPPFTG
ncbi:MAG: NAD(P)-dependent oxidoreductase [Candidatus Rokuibacteriota bacterium]|nr:MAG: NAD(P)-dependent oxidoreductase [Candidatus Rokubacteria bacterium]